MPERIHVIFKTHLDIGFTDYAENIFRQYCDVFIPNALKIARDLRESGRPERFLWTTGSWLIYEYLEQADKAHQVEMENAILAGDIRWHALPFTAHSEIMDVDLFRSCLGLSKSLDSRFGVKTIAAKMTDVPGHTRGIVPLLAEAGVRLLHIGVNPASSAPDVPDIFRWRDTESGSDVIMLYDKDDYGGIQCVDGLGDALAFAHTGDNNGPQSIEAIIHEFSKLRTQFPDADIHASTLDAFAQALLPIASQLPVIENEIGDCWIYGTGCDPYKTSAFRELLRLRHKWLNDGLITADADDYQQFLRHLMLIPEHTWGLDEKNALADYVNYQRTDFERARAADSPSDDVPEDCKPFAAIRSQERLRGYQFFEGSWAEQRGYLTKAIDSLQNKSLVSEAEQALLQLTRPCPDAVISKPISEINTRWFNAIFDPETGAVISLIDNRTGHNWASANHPLALLRYETYCLADYERYMREYCKNMDKHSAWAIPDFSKAGLRPEHADHTLTTPKCESVSHAGNKILFKLKFSEETQNRYGAPAIPWLEYTFSDEEPVINITAGWEQKAASRLPEALWCSFSPCIAEPAQWRMEKLGRWISTLDIISSGNRNLHAIGKGLNYSGSDGKLAIDSLDAHLVAPGAMRMLQYDKSQPPMDGGMHFNLYNNLYATNFRMWYEDNARFRFVVRF